MTDNNIFFTLERKNLDTLITLMLEEISTLKTAYGYVSEQNNKLTKENNELKIKLAQYETIEGDDRK